MYPDEFQQAQPEILIPEETLLSYAVTCRSSIPECLTISYGPFSSLSAYPSCRDERLLSFEINLLACYHDISIPYTTFFVNKRHMHIWTQIVPLHFSESQALKLCILAAGCLWMIPFIKLHVNPAEFRDLAYPNGECNEDWKLEMMSGYLLDALCLTNAAIHQLRNDTHGVGQYNSLLGNIMVSSAILYGIVGLYPGSLLPLVHFPGTGEELKVDFLSHSMKFRLLILEHFHLLPELDVGDLFQLDEIRFIPPMRIVVIEQIREKLNSHYNAASFLEINSKLAEEIMILRDSLVALEKICALTIKYNYPVRLFQWLLFCRVEFIELVRKKTPFALRLLYLYACLCIRYRCWLFEDNMWTAFVHEYHEAYSPLPEFDERMFNAIVVRCNYTENDFTSLKLFDIWSPEFAP